MRLSQIAALALALLFSTLALSAEQTGDVLPVPPLSGHVIDSSQTLSTAQAQALEQKLSAFERAHGTQMVICVP